MVSESAGARETGGAAAAGDPETVRGLLFERIRGCIRTGRVVLSSGKETDFYFDGRTVSLDPEGSALIGSLVLEELALRPEIEGLGGPTSGADPIVSATGVLAYQRGRPLRLFYVRKEAKSHGMQRRVEGPELPPGTQVFLADDVLTTGGSLLRAVEAVREDTGADVRGVIVLVDREEGGRERLEAAGLEVVALFRKGDFPA